MNVNEGYNVLWNCWSYFRELLIQLHGQFELLLKCYTDKFH